MSSRLLRGFAIFLSAGAGVAIGVILHVHQPWLLLSAALETPRPSAPTSPSSSASAVAPSATAQMSSVPPANASGSAAPPSASSSAAPSSSAAASSDSPNACIRALFAEDTFESPEPELAKLCEDKSSSKFAKRVKELLVTSSHGRMTGGMKEWGQLGIYELAAMAAMRGHCCPNAAPLEVAGPPGTCPPLALSLTSIGAAARPNAPPADLDAAVAAFDKDVRCVIRSQQTQAFGDYGPLGGGEGTALDKTIRRIRGPSASP